MNVFNKLKWVLGVLVVFMLIVATNLIDRNNFQKMRDTVTTIYADRLVAKDLIFEVDRVVHEKEMAVVLSDTLYFSERNGDAETAIQDFLIDFEHTKLTYKEGKVFNDLKERCTSLQAAEKAFIHSGYTAKEPLMKEISEVKGILYELSKIQLAEGGKQVLISESAIDSVELFTHIEIYILIFLAILIQIILIYNPKRKKETDL
jgi:hypothetical protein